MWHLVLAGQDAQDRNAVTITKPKSRLLRISLRGLLLFMFVVCSVLGWKVSLARKQPKAVAWVQQSGGGVIYDYELDSAGRRVRNAKPPGPAWLRDRLGIDYFTSVVCAATDRVIVNSRVASC